MPTIPFPGVIFKRGSKGDNVKKIQARLLVQQTGIFGPTTEACVIDFQESRGLAPVDGEVGPNTWNALFTTADSPTISFPGVIFKQGSSGPDVKKIQERLGVDQTGTFGETTEECVSNFQRMVGLLADGEVGPLTWAALFSPSPSKDTGLASLQEARNRIGIKEKPLGSNRGPEVDQFLTRSGVPFPNPWCMAFVYFCVDEAARKLARPNPIKKTASCQVLFLWARANGRLVSRPEEGDIFLVIGEGGHCHTGFVNGPIVNNRFPTVEGNSNNDGSSNGTAVVSRTPGRLLSSCHYVRL